MDLTCQNNICFEYRGRTSYVDYEMKRLGELDGSSDMLQLYHLEDYVDTH